MHGLEPTAVVSPNPEGELSSGRSHPERLKKKLLPVKSHHPRTELSDFLTWQFVEARNGFQRGATVQNQTRRAQRETVIGVLMMCLLFTTWWPYTPHTCTTWRHTHTDALWWSHRDPSVKHWAVWFLMQPASGWSFNTVFMSLCRFWQLDCHLTNSFMLQTTLKLSIFKIQQNRIT